MFHCVERLKPASLWCGWQTDHAMTQRASQARALDGAEVSSRVSIEAHLEVHPNRATYRDFRVRSPKLQLKFSLKEIV
jgi:hypothetical protein